MLTYPIGPRIQELRSNAAFKDSKKRMLPADYCILGRRWLQRIVEKDHLKISIREDEKKHTAKLLSLAEQHHLIIVILLLTNAVLCKALPIFMDNLVPTTSVAIILRVVLILIFEEILPSAAFIGPDQLELL
eukprot:scaffold3074_cov280-Chaetoceros_neogracile.AAC.11